MFHGLEVAQNLLGYICIAEVAVDLMKYRGGQELYILYSSKRENLRILTPANENNKSFDTDFSGEWVLLSVCH